MFSITTIASSTTMPVARMIPKSVSVLMEKSITLAKANAPMSETGIVMVGMSVLRQLWRNRNITRTTSAIDSSSVLRTSRIDSSTTWVVLNATWYFRPGGNVADSRWSSARTRRSTSSALALGSWMTANPTASIPWNRSCDA